MLLVGRQEGHPACEKNWVVGCWRGCLGWGADLHIAQQMPLPLTVSCCSKSRLVITFLVLPSGTCSPGWSRTYYRRAVKRLCVCVFISCLATLYMLNKSTATCSIWTLNTNSKGAFYIHNQTLVVVDLLTAMSCNQMDNKEWLTGQWLQNHNKLHYIQDVLHITVVPVINVQSNPICG